MAAHGYEGQSVLTDGSEFVLPARRRRLYVFLVRVQGNPLLSFQDRNVDSIFTTFGGLLSGCLRHGPCASDILLEDHHPAVLEELQLRTWRREEQNRSEKPAPTGDWPDQHMKLAQALRLRWGQGAPPELASNPWFQTLTAREQDALPLLQAQMPAEKSMMRDLSQSIFRANANTWKTDAQKHLAPTMLPKMNVWIEPVGHHVKKARMLLGREALLYHGFPVLLFLETLQKMQQDIEAAGRAKPIIGDELLRNTGGNKRPNWSSDKPEPRGRDLLVSWKPTEALMQDLAGNAMALPVVMTMLQCAFASVSWRPKDLVGTAAAAPVSTQEAWEGARFINSWEVCYVVKGLNISTWHCQRSMSISYLFYLRL